jgi:hypothetical protein
MSTQKSLFPGTEIRDMGKTLQQLMALPVQAAMLASRKASETVWNQTH